MRTRIFLLVALLLTATACGSDPATDAAHDHAATPDLTAGTPALSAEKQLYTCGMHPNVVQEGPGTCPICGMNLVPVNPTLTDGDVIEIDPGTVQTIGVRTAEVGVAPLRRTVRTTGRFVMDEQGARTVTLKIGGWVERLYVDFEGALVREGQPMLDLYSPELVTTQEEFLLALAAADRMAASGSAEGQEDARRLVEAARRRLDFYEMPADLVRRLETERKPVRTIPFAVPASGEVMNKSVVEGQKIEAGQPLLQIFDTSSIWLVADVYEQDLPWIKVGSPAFIQIPYAPDQRLSGRVDHLYYMLNTETRSAEARISLRRTGSMLRPGMYAVVELEGTATEPSPVVPEEAVLWTGEQSILILSLGAGRFRPISVMTGVQSDGFVQVLEGLEGGEQVVVSAQFLIDSEARLKSAVGAMIGTHRHDELLGGSPPAPTARTTTPVEAPRPAPPPAVDPHAGHKHEDRP